MIGLRIEQKRKELDMTMEELAAAIGFQKQGKQRINRIEKWDMQPTNVTLRNVCKGLGVTPAELARTTPETVKKILERKEQPFLQDEHEFYYLAGALVSTIIGLKPGDKKLRLKYTTNRYVIHGNQLKQELKEDIEKISEFNILKTPSQQKLLMILFNWESKIDNIKQFKTNKLLDDYVLGYYQTENYSIF